MGRRILVAAVMGLVLALVVVAGLHNYRSRQQAVQQAQNQVTLVKDGSSPGSTDGAGNTTVDGGGSSLKGKTAPGFTLVDLSGKKVSLADFKGKAVILNFWATWCGPCKLEMPWFEEFSKKYQDQGLVVLGLSQDDESTPKDEIEKAAKKIGVSYPILLSDGKIHKAYGGVELLPETFYVNKSGVVIADTAGAPSKDQMEALIHKALGI